MSMAQGVDLNFVKNVKDDIKSKRQGAAVSVVIER